jgi:hypothetical protein
MDSRIREVLEKIRTAEAYGGLGYAVHRLLKEAREALSLLTAEPEPCDLVRWVPYKGSRLTDGKGNGINVQGELNGFYRVVEADAYASRREQATRADERRRCAERAIEWYDQTDDPIQSQRDDIRAAILQGTEPAKVSEEVEMDVETVRSFFNVSQAYAKYKKEKSKASAALSRLVSRIKEGR